MALTAPAIPASGTVIPNTTGWYLDVSLTGGTVSNVTVTTQTGSTATVATSSPCSFAVPPGGSYTITYSVVPTGMTWADPLQEGYTPTYSAANLQLVNEEGTLPWPAHEEGGEPGLGIAVDN